MKIVREEVIGSVEFGNGKVVSLFDWNFDIPGVVCGFKEGDGEGYSVEVIVKSNYYGVEEWSVYLDENGEEVDYEE